MELRLHYSYNHIKMSSFGRRTQNLKKGKWPFLAMVNPRQNFLSFVISLLGYLWDMENT